jgi:hypothetical protein
MGDDTPASAAENGHGNADASTDERESMGRRPTRRTQLSPTSSSKHARPTEGSDTHSMRIRLKQNIAAAFQKLAVFDLYGDTHRSDPGKYAGMRSLLAARPILSL